MKASKPKTIIVRVDKNTHKKIENNKQGMSKSDFVRYILSQFFGKGIDNGVKRDS